MNCLSILLALEAIWLCAGQSTSAGTAAEKWQRRTDVTLEAAIGIDFGASHIRVGIFRNGEVTILRNEQGSELTPSYVAFTSSGHRLFGDAAKSQVTTNPRSTVFSVLPLLGRKFDDAVVQDHIKRIPYAVIDRNGWPEIDVQVGDHIESFSPEGIVAMLLRKMKEIAERHLNEAVRNAVVSVPSCFSYVQRRAMRDAGRIAGLNETQVVNSHMATALAYLHLSADQDGEKRIMVLDLGGSSLGVSVISVTSRAIVTKTQSGHCQLGGDQFEQRVIEQMMKLFGKQRSAQLAQKVRHDSRAVQKLRREVEKAIRLLSSADLAYVEVESLIDGMDFSQALTRARFEELNLDLLRKALDMVENVLDESIHEIVIVGGSSRIPWIREHTRNLLNSRESKIKLDLDKASAIGAALWAAVLDGNFGSPEAEHDAPHAVMFDTFSQSLGYKNANDQFKKIMSFNDIIPGEKSDNVTVRKSAESSKISSGVLNVYEGEEFLASNASFVGSIGIEFPAISSATVSVTFKIDSGHVLQVSLEEMNSGEGKTVRFDHRLSQKEMRKMIRRLQILDDTDRFESKRLEVRDELESSAYLVKRQINKAALLTDGFKTGDLMKAERAAIAIIDWLETNRHADADEFLMKKVMLTMAVEKFKV